MYDSFDCFDELTQKAIINAVRNGSTNKLYSRLAPFFSYRDRWLLMVAIEEAQSRIRETNSFDNDGPKYPDNRSHDEKLSDYDNLGYMLTGCERLSPVAERYYGIHRC